MLLLAAACAAPPSPNPWTLRTIDTLGDPAVVPPGATLRLLSSPFTTGTAIQKPGQTGLTVFPAFSEGDTAAYMTTEVWQNFDAVWVQPLYVPVTTYDPTQAPKIAAPAVFGVDSSTRFYSPYWEILYYVNPPGAEFHSAREILDSGVTLHPGPGKFCPLTRDPTVAPAQAQSAPASVRPLSGEGIAAFRGNLDSYAEGNEVRFLELGIWAINVFTWDRATRIVRETPLFAFTRIDAAGNAVEVDLPRVAGTGPFHHPTCDGLGHCQGLQSNGIPQFGALWRVYDVLLPADADVYVPEANVDLKAYVRSMGFKGRDVTSVSVTDPKKYTL
ncbi:MAG: hypothetical protein LC689_22450, partial [Myxococcales bacterium]|nr:hypothetical protein [Myxococcales bacterium]